MYSDYIKEFGVILFILFILTLFIGSTTARVIGNLYMADWSTKAGNMTKEESMHSLIVYGIYGLTAGRVIIHFQKLLYLF